MIIALNFLGFFKGKYSWGRSCQSLPNITIKLSSSYFNRTRWKNLNDLKAKFKNQKNITITDKSVDALRRNLIHNVFTCFRAYRGWEAELKNAIDKLIKKQVI